MKHTTQCFSADRSGDDCQFLWGKALQNARRISLVIACGRRWDGAEIEKSDAVYGCAMIRCAIRRFADAIELNISDSQWENDKQRLFKLIEASGTMGMSKRELTRRTQWIKDRRTRDAYLADMQDAGMIVFGTNPEQDSKQGWLWTRKYGKAAVMTRSVESNE